MINTKRVVDISSTIAGCKILRTLEIIELENEKNNDDTFSEKKFFEPISKMMSYKRPVDLQYIPNSVRKHLLDYIQMVGSADPANKIETFRPTCTNMK